MDGHLDFPASKFLGSESERVRASLLLSLALLRTRACSIARPCHTKYRTMFTMIDTIGARAGHATARAPAIHRVRCVRFSRGPSSNPPQALPAPTRHVRGSAAARGFHPAGGAVHPPARILGRRRSRGRAGAHVRRRRRARRRRGEEDEVRRRVQKSIQRRSRRGACDSLLILPPVSRDAIASTASSSVDPSPQTHTRRTA